MSQTHVLIVKDDQIYLLSTHYKSAMKLLATGPEHMLPYLKHCFLDAGYLVVDLNKKVILNSQDAFPVSGRVGTRKFEVYDV